MTFINGEYRLDARSNDANELIEELKHAINMLTEEDIGSSTYLIDNRKEEDLIDEYLS
jgi:hypothetical protein